MRRNSGAPPPPSYRLPITILAVLLFLLVGGIVVVLSARAGRQADRPCPVGEWDVASYSDAVEIDDIHATVTFTGGTGTVLRLREDGTGETDYGTGVSFNAEAPDGRDIRIDVSGLVHFTYVLGSGGHSVVVTPAGNDSTSQLSFDGAPYGAKAKFRDDRVGKTYSVDCAGDSLTQDGNGMVVGYRRR